jgi:putative DNA primase/helicase
VNPARMRLNDGRVGGYCAKGAVISSAHIDLLVASAIDPEVARERGYRTETVKARLKEKRLPGLPGLLIPGYSSRGELAFYQLRPDEPRLRDGKPIKYESQHKSSPTLDIHPRLSRPREWRAPGNTEELLAADPARKQRPPLIHDTSVPLWITEGARKADSAISRSLCSIGLIGVSAWHRIPAWNDIVLKGRLVYIAFDSDAMTKQPVWIQLRDLKAWLETHGASVRIVYLPPGENGEKVGLDDYIARLVAAGLNDEEIRQKLVNLAREQLTPLAGAEASEVQPAPQWAPMLQEFPDNVIGAVLFAELVAAIERFVMMEPAAAKIVALWVLFTWVFEHYAETNPYLRVVSPTPGCGKSTLLKVLRYLTRSGWLIARLTSSSFTRTMNDERRTLLLDEGDAFLHENEQMRNVLNAASDPDTANVSLSEKRGDVWVPIELNCYVPIAIASIGRLRHMETVEDRSISTHLKKATGTELKKLDKGRRKTMKAVLEPLALKCAKWAADNVAALEDVHVELSDEMNGREQDKWEPLVAIAHVLGSEIEKEALEIASRVSASRGDDGATYGVMIIRDLAEIFDSNQGEEFIATTAILDALHQMEHRPWPAYGRSQKPLTPHALRRLLKPFAVSPVHNATKTTRGYQRADLGDAFTRYALISPLQSVHVSETHGEKGNIDFPKRPAESSSDTLNNAENHTESGVSDVRTLRTPPISEKEIDRGPIEIEIEEVEI